MSKSSEFVNLSSSKHEDDLDLESIDALLAKLTTEEIDELNDDFDPDNSLLPPSERMKAQTSKDATGPFSRKKLMAFLEKKAKDEKDWENIAQYVKKIPEKRWKPKEEIKTQDMVDIETEWDDILTQASEEELVDLAAVLGFHGMLNQTQYYASEHNEKIEGGGFTGIAKAEALKTVKYEPPNMTDVEECLKQLKDNDSKLKHLNLNNMKNISNERLAEICDSLKTNTNLDILEMSSVAMTEKIAKLQISVSASAGLLFFIIDHRATDYKKLAAGLQENKTLRVLNIESNFISGDCIVEILKAVNKNQTLIELRVANQKPECLGNKVETMITRLIQENDTLLTFGIAFEFPDARVRVTEKLQENNDQLRLKRVADKGVA